ncbi:flagellar hook assembly protein FlgD [Kushneria indalinina]|uniref:Basal-body rod modification protein FlgD n=1 Tax=Kushneria indalinina DSM 14324 TaxID=1122140 RepID=A0A3D9DZV9_9GAMM|nr:flagellar hook assembly protein FlgD [Kushneria indalinina]REC96343.1 flagellar basal-body rod modification protein FlgD [Kushneria indalinina DSM 14324]
MAFDNSLVSRVNGTSTTGGTNGSGMGATSASDLGEEFMSLLVAQLKNQDPLNPMENSEFTSQIAQINTVSGIDKLNNTLSSITGQIDASQKLQAGAMVGRGVLVEGNKIHVDNNTVLPFGIELDDDAAKVTATITDGSGRIINQYDLTKSGPMSAGVQSFNWDGTDASNTRVEDGTTYQVSIAATDGSGRAVASRALQYGYVSGVMTANNATKLDLGPNMGSVAFNDVKQIL